MNTSKARFNNLIEAVRELNIPSADFTIVGSLSLRHFGLIGNTPRDIDIVVSEQQWLRLSAFAPVKRVKNRPCVHLNFASGLYIDIKSPIAHTKEFVPSMIACSMKTRSMINGVNIVDPLNDLAYKNYGRREKDDEVVRYVLPKLHRSS